MLDEQTYGFNKADATELVQLIGGEDREHNDWHPVPNDGSGGASKYAARMTEAWTAKQATCEIYTLDGIIVTYLANAEVYDPLSVFAALGADDWMYCTLQGGKYYAADAANCPGTSPLIADPPDTQP